LNEVHTADLLHKGKPISVCLSLGLSLSKGLSLYSIGLSNRERLGQSKLVKVVKVSYYVKLLDLHRSNPFGVNPLPTIDSTNLPESWSDPLLVLADVLLIHLRLAKDGHDSALIYTKARDIHYAGVVFLQMLMGCDVAERFPDAQAALVSCESLSGATSSAYTSQP
jgi:eukaryotic translation initiation factor 2-alpha kinase 4